MTIALVEIGTRAIRLLVVAADEKSGFQIVATGVEDSPLSAAPVPYVGVAKSARELRSTIDKLLRSASHHVVDEVLVFGTHSVRKLGDVAVQELLNNVPNLRVLSAVEEARACHASACLVANLIGVHASTIISGDIGHGSFELCVGGMPTPGICDQFLVTEFGSQRLLELYLNGGVAEVERGVAGAFAKEPFAHVPRQGALLFFSGSPATKFAWLMYRSSICDNIGIPYDMQKVQGAVFTQDVVVENLAVLDRLRTKNRDKAAQLVSPANPQSHEVEVLIAGLQVIRSTMERTHQGRFLVNAFGARHGVAWMRLHGLTL